MESETEGWAIGGLAGAEDHVLRTEDGGVTWADVTPPEPAQEMPYTRQVAIGYFADAGTGWVAYAQAPGFPGQPPAVVWHTSDAGQTWDSSFPLDLAGLQETFVPFFLGFADRQVGWLMVGVGAGMSHQYVVLYMTGDGGRTWERVLDPYGDSPIQVCWKTGLAFADAQTGWLTRDCGGVVDGAFVDVTRDGGRTWTSVELLPPADQPEAFGYPNACGTHSPVLASPRSGLVGVSCEIYEPGEVRLGPSLVYRTEDGGASWSAASAPPGELGMLDGRLTWAFGREIQRTPDEGLTWSLIKSVSWDGQFDFVTLDRGWAVARDGEEIALVRTVDGGATWQLLEPVTGSGE